MKYILPIIIAFSLLTIGCSKDKETSEQAKEIKKQEREKFVGDSLFSVYGVKFTNPGELKVMGATGLYKEGIPNFIFGLRDGEPWIAVYNESNSLLVENSQALPDSIMNDYVFKDIKFNNFYDFGDAFIVDVTINNNVNYNDPIAQYFYYYDKKDNTIRRYIYDYGENGHHRQVVISEWYNDSFLILREGRFGTYIGQDYKGVDFRDNDLILDKDFNIIKKFNNERFSIPNEAGLTWYPGRRAYPLSNTEYFTISYGGELSIAIVKSSINSFWKERPYPEPPHYSYELESKRIEVFDRPSNFVRLDDYKFEEIDHGDRLEAKIEGTMLQSDDPSKPFHKKWIQGSVFIDKKTGIQIK